MHTNEKNFQLLTSLQNQLLRASPKRREHVQNKRHFLAKWCKNCRHEHNLVEMPVHLLKRWAAEIQYFHKNEIATNVTTNTISRDRVAPCNANVSDEKIKNIKKDAVNWVNERVSSLLDVIICRRII